MKQIMICLIAALCFSCQKKQKPENISSQLKTAMTHFLYKSVNYDSSKVKYRINNVAYFEEGTYYNCVFEVRMLLTDKDTIGVMKATVSKKDFEQIKRMQ